MKTIIVIMFAAVFSAYAITGAVLSHPDKYCAKMRDGKKVVMYQGSVMTTDATLSNGTVVKTDGTILKPDNTTVVLKTGECIDKEGVIAKEMKKTKKSK